MVCATASWGWGQYFDRFVMEFESDSFQAPRKVGSDGRCQCQRQEHPVGGIAAEVIMRSLLCVCLFQGQSGRFDVKVDRRVFFNMFEMNVVSLLGLCGLSTDFKLRQLAKVCAPRADPCDASLVAKVFR